MPEEKRTTILTATITSLKVWIEKNLAGKINTRRIAATSGYSSRHLHSGFVQLTGMSPASYVRTRKLTQAAYLLQLTKLSVTEIAHRYAFSSLQCFSRAFRRHFGLSPLAYRKAGQWDLQHTQPLPAHRTFRYTVHRLSRKSLWLHPFRRQRVSIPLRDKLVINDHGDLREELYHFFYNNIFRHITAPVFTVQSCVHKNKNPSLNIHITTGSLSNRDSRNAVFIPPSHWLCYMFTGSLRETILFTNWVNCHGLKTTGVMARLDQTLTTYIRHPEDTDKFSICYALPF